MSHLNSSTLLLGHFANLKLAGDRAVRDAILSLQSSDPALSTSSAMRTIFKNPAPPSSRRRRRKPRPRSSSRLHSLSDADLEAELVSRRAARARERDKYARAMRSEKLSVLESELARLRFEIARLDKGATPPFTGSGTPPNARWQSFPQTRRSLQRNSPASRAPSVAPRVAPSGASPAGSGPSVPPPTPPPPPLQLGGPSRGRGGEGDDTVIDLEKQRREKEERQRRREAKRKEREAAKKPMTLADIIRSAGPDPARRLKPSGSTALPDVNDPKDDMVGKEEIGKPKEGLQKVEEGEEQTAKGEQVSEERKEEEPQAENGEKRPANGSSSEEKEADAQASDKELEKLKENTISKERRENGKVGGEGKPKETTKSKTSAPDHKDPEPETASTIVHDAEAKPETEGSVAHTVTEKNPVEEQGSEIEATANGGETAMEKTNASKAEVALLEKPERNGRSIEVGSEPKENGGAADAIAAISALAASLPAKKGGVNSSKRPAQGRKSLEERRRMRRASAKVKGSEVGQRRGMEGKEFGETAKSVTGLKVD